MAAGEIVADLPFIDEHSIEVGASPERTWEALVRASAGAFDGGAKAKLARLLGCDPAQRSGEAGVVGSTVAGFRVTEAAAPRSLVLEGAHRFSSYRLTFGVEETLGGSRVSATTEAEFPGLHGRAYRALVIGTRAHVLVTRRILRAIRYGAERAPV